MLERFQKLLANDQAIEFDLLFCRLFLAFALGCAVAGIYVATHRRKEAMAPGFVPTLVLLAILIAVVTQVIGENLARAFSLAGALAIVRFRTVVEDTRDTAFVIFAVVEGMAVGANYLVMALAGLLLAGLAAFVVRPKGPAATVEWSLSLRFGIGDDEPRWQEIFQKHLEDVQLLSTTTARQGAALDLTFRVRLRPAATPVALVGDLNKMERIQSVELRRL